MPDPTVRKPGVLNILALLGFLLTVLNVIWIAFVGAIIVVAGAASWFAGPVVGALGSLVAFLVVLVLLAQSFLSVLLFLAAWKTWNGAPGGRSLHLLWAWITVVIDLIDLAFTGGIDGGAWARLIFAAIVIVVMERSDVLEFFGKGRTAPKPSKPTGPDDWAY